MESMSALVARFSLLSTLRKTILDPLELVLLPITFATLRWMVAHIANWHDPVAAKRRSNEPLLNELELLVCEMALSPL